ncbi:MAG: hypothetical protein WBG92_12275 [Thiohalocapsa sp.]
MPATSADAMREKMEKRHAEAMIERDKRYADLRQRAAEVGLELPEAPPWTQPGMPEGMPQGMPEQMMTPPAPMTAEDMQAMREKRWEEMRARAAERGMEFPETAPWEAAEKRRKEMLERYEEYRATIEAMTDEQKEAVSALFGSARASMPYPMPSYGAPCGPHGGPHRSDCLWGFGAGPGMDQRFPGMVPGRGPSMRPAITPEPPAPAIAPEPAG